MLGPKLVPLGIGPQHIPILNLGIYLRLDNIVDGFDDLTVASGTFKLPHFTNSCRVSIATGSSMDAQWGENVLNANLQQQLESVTCIQPCIRSIIEDANGCASRQTRTLGTVER
jgi:hypothetical protein